MTESPESEMPDAGSRTERFEAAPQRDAFDAADAHATLDVRETLADASAVVPTDRDDNYTLASAPDWLDVVVRRDDGLNVARNRGVEAADSDWIVLVDDDVTFPTQLTATLVDGMHDRHLVGLEDFWPMDWIIGRFMVFHRSLWEAAGGFDESRPHGGDTDFAIRCEKAGGRVLQLPRRTIPHHDVESAFSTAAHAEWLWYLFRRHPRQVALPAAKLALSKVGLLEPRRADYPDDWTGQASVPPERDGERSE